MYPAYPVCTLCPCIFGPGFPNPVPLICSATINRYGFNSVGADAAEENLKLFTAKAAKDPEVKGGERREEAEEVGVDSCHCHEAVVAVAASRQ